MTHRDDRTKGMSTDQNINWITNFLWGIADDVLRDLYVRGKYRDVILPMVVLQRLDAVLEPTKSNVLKMHENLDAKKNSDKQNARVEHDKALMQAIVSIMNDDGELFKQFMDNPSFKSWLTHRIFEQTYETTAA